MEDLTLPNRNFGKKNPSVRVTVKASPKDEGWMGSVWLHIEAGFLSGGFHTSIEAATALRDSLTEAIDRCERVPAHMGVPQPTGGER